MIPLLSALDLIFFLLLISGFLKTRRSAVITAMLLTVFQTAAIDLTLGRDNLQVYASVFNFAFPLLFFPGVVLSVYLLFLFTDRMGRGFRIIPCAIVVNYAMLNLKLPDLIWNVIDTGHGAPIRLGGFALLMAPFLVVSAGFLPSLVNQNKSLYSRFFGLSGILRKRQLAVIGLNALAYFLFLYVAGRLSDHPLTWGFVVPVSHLPEFVFIKIFFSTLVDQVALILIPRLLLAELFRHEPMRPGWTLLLGLVYGILHFPAGLEAVILSTLTGIIFANLYQRTRSISYGIMLESGVAVFMV